MVSIPVLLKYFFFRWAKRSKYKKFLYITALIPLAIVAYAVYNSVYPADEFYKENFEEVTGMRFPDHSEIISKSASYPDTHGDYTSAAAIKMSSKEYITLLDKMKISTFKNEAYNTSSPQLSIVERHIKARKYKTEYVKKFEDKEYFVGFLPNHTVVFCRISW